MRNKKYNFNLKKMIPHHLLQTTLVTTVQVNAFALSL